MMGAEAEPKKRSALTVVGAALALVSSALVGGFLISKGWVFIGGAAVFFGFLSAGGSLKPAKFAEGFVTVFWVGWSGFGVLALLRDGRIFSALPVILLFLVGAFRLRRLFQKKQAADALPAAERVIDGELAPRTAKRPSPNARDG